MSFELKMFFLFWYDNKDFLYKWYLSVELIIESSKDC